MRTQFGRRAMAALAAIGALVAVMAAPGAMAAGVGPQWAQAVAKRAASARVERFGISYPPRTWKAACDPRAVGGWRCEVGTRGQCSGVGTVVGTSVRPRVRRVDVSCFG